MLRDITKDDLELVRHWRNAETVRRAMYNSKKISKDEHEKHFEKIKNTPSILWLVFVMDNIDYGVVSFSGVGSHECIWGFYLSDELSGKKAINVWKILETEAIEYAFKTLAYDKLFCEVFAFNTPVLTMHRKFGFKVISERTMETCNREENVIKFCLSKDDYSNSKTNFSKK